MSPLQLHQALQLLQFLQACSLRLYRGMVEASPVRPDRHLACLLAVKSPRPSPQILSQDHRAQQALPATSFVTSSLALVPGAVRAQDWTVRYLGGTSVWLLQGCVLNPLQPPLSSVKASDPDLPSPDEKTSLWGTIDAEVESHPLSRRTQNYLPVDPLPAGIDAPLDWLATGIPDEEDFCVKTAC